MVSFSGQNKSVWIKLNYWPFSLVESDVYNKIGEYYEAGKKLRGFLESRIPPVSERRMSKALKDVEKHYREKCNKFYWE